MTIVTSIFLWMAVGGTMALACREAKGTWPVVTHLITTTLLVIAELAAILRVGGWL